MKKQDISLTAVSIRKLADKLAESISTAKNSGSALVTFCDAASSLGLSDTPAESDCIAIVDAVASKLGWTGTPRESASKSEARNIVRQHAFVPELQTALRASDYGACSYHDTVKLCRLMKKHKTVRATIQAFNTRSSEGKSVSANDKFARAMRSFYQTVSESRAKDKSARLAALRKCASAFGFEIVTE